MDPMQEDNLTQLFGYIIKGLFKAAAFLTMSKKTALPYIGGVPASLLFLFGLSMGYMNTSRIVTTLTVGTATYTINKYNKE